MKYARYLVFLLLIMVPLFAYGCSRENARSNVPYRSKQFISHAAQGDYGEVKLLLEAGMDVNAKDQDGATALMGASIKGHAEVIKLLLSKGADIK